MGPSNRFWTLASLGGVPETMLEWILFVSLRGTLLRGDPERLSDVSVGILNVDGLPLRLDASRRHATFEVSSKSTGLTTSRGRVETTHCCQHEMIA